MIILNSEAFWSIIRIIYEGGRGRERERERGGTEREREREREREAISYN